IVGQQISVTVARTHLSRLAAVGDPYRSGIPGLTRLFPTPAQVAGAATDRLRLPARSVGAVATAARAMADGALALDVGQDPAELRAALLALPGVGPWTAGYVSMRVLGDPDAWLDGDVALEAGARAVGIIDDRPRAAATRLLTTRAAEWAPWRSYAVIHLWRAAITSRTPHPGTRTGSHASSPTGATP